MDERSKPYIITAAHYDESETRLQYVFVGIPPESAGMTVDGIRLYGREQLIAELESGSQFSIAYMQHGEWQDGGEIFLVSCDGERYIRGDHQALAIDDLGNLARIRASR
jgi:hypothetical protein